MNKTKRICVIKIKIPTISLNLNLCVDAQNEINEFINISLPHNKIRVVFIQNKNIFIIRAVIYYLRDLTLKITPQFNLNNAINVQQVSKL